ncbi:ATP-grasp ribosomal peptide maturase [Actinocorallia sp. B10E7]|uniref:ATP-grasp ribosomal peptide maturase n=1 Tax=Actinocorallia sp. B10E7 TaxID=3153558 RepID=UPI00325E9711
MMISRASVLVVTSDDDYGTDLVIQALDGTPVVRLNPGTGVHVDAELAAGQWRGTVGDGRRHVDIDTIVSVFWRWPDPPAGDPSIADEAARRWAAREDYHALYGLLRGLPVRWVNHPGRAQAAEDKPRQLAIAHQCGLVTPATLITTRGAAVRRWLVDRPLIYKAFRADGADEDCMVTAGSLDRSAVPDRLLAAHTVQERVDGVPVRLTVVGDELFAVRITGTDLLDWRPVQGGLAYAPTEVPPPIRRSVLTYMRAFDLLYGAFDFIDPGDGPWVFLECNPTGQWGFVDRRTNLPITGALAGLLRTPLPQCSGSLMRRLAK